MVIIIMVQIVDILKVIIIVQIMDILNYGYFKLWIY